MAGRQKLLAMSAQSSQRVIRLGRHFGRGFCIILLNECGMYYLRAMTGRHQLQWW